MGQTPCSCQKGPGVNAQVIDEQTRGDNDGDPFGNDGSEPLSSQRVVLEGGAYYEGGWLGAEKHGRGILTLPTGSRYVGEFEHDRQWDNDFQFGQGEERWSDGSVFEGQFSNGTKNGSGRFLWINQCKYDGQFESNDMHGDGTYRWSDGRIYAGQWQRNSMGPVGKMWWVDGRSYDGEFDEGRKHGQGSLTWPDGRSYSGQWLDGKQHGAGVACTSGGRSRKSRWENGKFAEWLGEVQDALDGVGQTFSDCKLPPAEIEVQVSAAPGG